MTYEQFFQRLTGHAPLPYQRRLAEPPWPDVLDIPTGLGKTAAIVSAWLFQRLQDASSTPRRLVYCLPMRVLVEQTQQAATTWCNAAGPYFDEAQEPLPSVHVLMGGQVDESWEQNPERPAILIGTQDMLLSRALNRGYAMSRYRWPMHFALLNNDALWVFDETQLMGVGVETGAQLAAFRDALGTLGPTRSVWMSATVGQSQLDTVDHPRPDAGWRTHRLEGDDLQHPVVQQRISARKPLRLIEDVRLDKESEKGAYVANVTRHVLGCHEDRRGLTLVLVNTVARARDLYSRLRRADKRITCALVHSRFRPADRDRHEDVLQEMSADRIVVATQAVEAGVDISSRTLITELAPWPSLVQRLGRCNRYGTDAAAAFWLDIDTGDPKSPRCLPYAPDELSAARALLRRLAAGGGDAGPAALAELAYEPPSVVRPVIRRRDLVDLFDTTPDLSGQDLDVSRFVRDGDDTDVQVYWRAFEASPDELSRQPRREELCRISLAAARDFLSKLAKKRTRLGRGDGYRERRSRLAPWRWNPLERQWEAADRVLAGQVLLLHPQAGGYTPELGWTGEVEPKGPVPEIDGSSGMPVSDDAMDGDAATVIGRWVRLTDHLGHVQEEAGELSRALGPLQQFEGALATAGLWHDVGKSHDQFQRRLTEPVKEDPDHRPPGDGVWAKSSHRLRWTDGRPHFRHELASALAWLSAGESVDGRERDLIAYLVAAHHGKVRLSIRSVPGEHTPDDPERLFARGVWDGDVLAPLCLPGGRQLEALTLDLQLMRLGDGSWLERTLGLRDASELGPFRLALLETALRVADWRASSKEEGAHA